MRKIQKLVRNGNSTYIAVPRPMLAALHWRSGEQVLIELLENKTVRVRRITLEDIRPLITGPIDLELPLETGR